MIQEAAIQKAILLLNAVKAEYCIRFNGATYGTLEVQEPKKVTRRGMFKEAYKQIIEEMQVGGTHAWTYPEDIAESFRSSVTSCATHLWGKESYMSSVKTEDGEATIEILRLK